MKNEKIGGLIELFKNQEKVYENQIKYNNEQAKFYIYLFSFIITVLFSIVYVTNISSIRGLLAFFALVLLLITLIAVISDNRINKRLRERKIFFETQISALLFLRNSRKSFNNSNDMAKFLLENYPESKFKLGENNLYNSLYLDYLVKILDLKEE